MRNCWWLNASADELARARTCVSCGSPDADIDLNLCFSCWSQVPKSEQYRRLMVKAGQYGLEEREQEMLMKMRDAIAEENAVQRGEVPHANM